MVRLEGIRYFTIVIDVFILLEPARDADQDGMHTVLKPVILRRVVASHLTNSKLLPHISMCRLRLLEACAHMHFMWHMSSISVSDAPKTYSKKTSDDSQETGFWESLANMRESRTNITLISV